MSEDSDAPAKPRRRKKNRVDPGLRAQRLSRGEALRAAINDGLQRKGMSVAELARQAGMRSPSALHNFRFLKSNGLSVTTVTAVARVLGFDVLDFTPTKDVGDLSQLDVLEADAHQAGAPLGVLQVIERLRSLAKAQALGVSTPHSTESLIEQLVLIRVNLDEEGPRPTIALPQAMQEPLSGRVTPRDAARRAFGARVIAGAGGSTYPAGTVLICVPTLERKATALPIGRRAIVCSRPISKSVRWKKIQVELREVVQVDGKPRLVPIGSSGDRSDAVTFPEKVTAQSWTADGREWKVYAVVTAAIINEEERRP